MDIAFWCLLRSWFDKGYKESVLSCLILLMVDKVIVNRDEYV